jgi:hypothetical protein
VAHVSAEVCIIVPTKARYQRNCHSTAHTLFVNISSRSTAALEAAVTRGSDMMTARSGWGVLVRGCSYFRIAVDATLAAKDF